MQEKRTLKFATLNVGMLEEKSAGALRSSGQSGNDLSGSIVPPATSLTARSSPESLQRTGEF